MGRAKLMIDAKKVVQLIYKHKGVDYEPVDKIEKEWNNMAPNEAGTIYKQKVLHFVLFEAGRIQGIREEQQRRKAI